MEYRAENKHKPKLGGDQPWINGGRKFIKSGLPFGVCLLFVRDFLQKVEFSESGRIGEILGNFHRSLHQSGKLSIFSSEKRRKTSLVKHLCE